MKKHTVKFVGDTTIHFDGAGLGPNGRDLKPGETIEVGDRVAKDVRVAIDKAIALGRPPMFELDGYKPDVKSLRAKAKPAPKTMTARDVAAMRAAGASEDDLQAALTMPVEKFHEYMAKKSKAEKKTNKGGK